MHITLPILMAVLTGPVPMGPDDSFGVYVAINGDWQSDTLLTLVTNKAANGGELRDDTTSSTSGMGRTTDDDQGWSIHLRPDGAWGLNISDGTRTINYRPWGGRQPVLDGHLRQIGFILDRARNELRLYYDGDCRATISTEGLGDVGTGLDVVSGADTDGRTMPGQPDDLLINAKVLPRPVIPMPMTPPGKRPPAEPFDGTVSIMAWNIWHGGRHNGRDAGPDQVVEVIQDSGADIVCMQETYGSGPLIADKLNWYFVGRSSNCSVLSRFPITRTFHIWRGFHLTGAEVRLPDGRPIRAFSLWIHHLPDVGLHTWLAKPVKQMLDEEQETRGAQIAAIIGGLARYTDECDQIPMVVAGDFNSLSHLDWTDRNTRDGVRPVPWGVSRAMFAAGFTDAFRLVHPDAQTHPARTWSPRFPDQWQDRIDYVYTCGAVSAQDAAMIDAPVVDGAPFPSDHAAVVVELVLPVPDPPARP